MSSRVEVLELGPCRGAPKSPCTLRRISALGEKGWEGRRGRGGWWPPKPLPSALVGGLEEPQPRGHTHQISPCCQGLCAGAVSGPLGLGFIMGRIGGVVLPFRQGQSPERAAPVTMVMTFQEAQGPCASLPGLVGKQLGVWKELCLICVESSLRTWLWIDPCPNTVPWTCCLTSLNLRCLLNERNRASSFRMPFFNLAWGLQGRWVSETIVDAH